MYDAIILCNVYSEKKNFTLCYYDKAKANILKSSKEDKWNSVFEVSIKEDSTWYRLPSIYEWVVASLLKEDNVNAVEGKSFTSTNGSMYYFTSSNSVSGDTLNYDNEIERDIYPVNHYNSNSRVAFIESKKPNVLVAFDMFGNM